MLVLDVCSSSGLEDWSPDLQKAKVYERILLDLILGELAPGARLDEQSLAARYDAGLAGVRDALGRLALEGLVIRRARSGTLVAPLDLVELRQGYEARALIEPHCAGLAARHASKAEAEAILDAFADGETAARERDLPALVAMDQRFHAAVARASQNLALARILIPLQHKAARFWVFSFGGATEAELLADIEEHRQVARVIATGDVEGSRAAMMRVLNVTPEAVQRSNLATSST
ncbi:MULTISPECIES: GntR family transcriptional regulator [unclassified Caulobacter]|uniref:GntR family transcriptional regulator n=1 Tax=unclassified Caulobacter TaxID=2648921 RepID=UPI000D33A270|nr:MULTISPECIES: GntR family transcriptional regulator [unclassified Caulobacter]PTS90366.1 GntR family transcriptional regulator [Caulobacter sp. HMWF009]PTT08084.1 GntR family transcriptional regulator [Caulobacter sp. HMWF025]